MKTAKKLIAFIFIILFLASCDKSEKYDLDKTTSLHGKITINEINKDGKKEYISILELDKAVNIDGVLTDKIEIEYDKELKNNTETTVTGTLEKNNGKTDLKYSISVDYIDNILSYVNSFSNDIFSIAIPPKLMKESSVEKIQNGFIINSRNKLEVFRIIALENEEYKTLSKDVIDFEPIRSNKTHTIVIIYSKTAENTEDSSIDALYKEVENIKKSVKLK